MDFQLNHSLADLILDASAEAIMVTDHTNQIVRINPAFTAITGFSASEALGQRPSILSSGRQSREFYDALWFALKHRGYWQGEIWNKRKSGEIYAEWVSINVLRDQAGNVTHHVAFFSDITLQKEGEMRMQRLAHYDGLTGLGNRLLMRERLTRAMTSAQKGNHRVGVLFLDLDRFKRVNDQHGHHIGDALLIAVAERIKQVLGDDDTTFRLGGDEFIVMLPKIGNPSGAQLVAKRLTKALSKPFPIAESILEIGVSIGVSVFPEDGTSLDRLLDGADKQMYKTKSAGREHGVRGPVNQNLSL